MGIILVVVLIAVAWIIFAYFGGKGVNFGGKGDTSGKNVYPKNTSVLPPLNPLTLVSIFDEKKISDDQRSVLIKNGEFKAYYGKFNVARKNSFGYPVYHIHIVANNIESAKVIREKYCPSPSMIPGLVYFEIWTTNGDIIARDKGGDYENINHGRYPIPISTDIPQTNKQYGGIEEQINEEAKNNSVFLDTGNTIIPTSQNELEIHSKNINNLLLAHLDKIRDSFSSDHIVIDYINNIRDTIMSIVSPKAVEKLTLLLRDKNKHTFSCGNTLSNDISIFYVELYPSSKVEIKDTVFKDSYIDGLNNTIEGLYNQFKLTVGQFQNSTFFHIMFFIKDPIIEVDMGIRSLKFNFNNAPIDLLSDKDKKLTGL